MNIHRLPYPGAVLALALLASSPALAAPPPAAQTAQEPSGDADQRAARWLAAGNKAFKEGKFAEAERAYREAWSVKKGYDIAGNLGVSLLAQGKLREAAQFLAYTLRTFPITGEPAQREQMQRAFDECRRSVGAVHLTVSPRGAEVTVDGAPAGEAPLLDDVFVDPGEHVIEAKREGYRAASKRVAVGKGARVDLDLTLTALPPKEKTIVKIEPVPVKRRSVVPAVVLGSAGAVGIGAGIAFLGLSSGKRSDAEKQGTLLRQSGHSCIENARNYAPDPCRKLQETLGSDDAFHDVAVGAFVVGGIAAAGLAAYLLWPAPRRPSTGFTVRVTPVVGATERALIFEGAF